VWGSETHDFWCCHGSLVQAHTTHNAYAYYQGEEGLTLTQYVPTELQWAWGGIPVAVRQEIDTMACPPSPAAPDGSVHRPDFKAIDVTVRSEQPVDFALRVRLPFWLADRARISVNGEAETVPAEPSQFVELRRTWRDDVVRIELPRDLWAEPIPDDPKRIAFMEGPVVLAGLCDEERTLRGDAEDPTAILAPHNEREWTMWKLGYRAQNQSRGLHFKPLYEVVDEPYTVYFPFEDAPDS
jgi:hypothetical protein